MSSRRNRHRYHLLHKYATEQEVQRLLDKPKEMTMERKAPRTLRRLDAQEYYRLYKWLEAQTFEPGLTRAQVAKDATDYLGMEIADVHIGTALKTMGLSLPTVADPEALADRVKRLEEQVAQLIADKRTW